jgi:hypothetical protein
MLSVRVHIDLCIHWKQQKWGQKPAASRTNLALPEMLLRPMGTSEQDSLRAGTKSNQIYKRLYFISDFFDHDKE